MLFEQLDAVGISYVPVNVTASERAIQTLRDLGKNSFGMTTRMPTPTTLVGRRVIRGADVKRIQQALIEERKGSSTR
ncbi:hypothetical protein LLH23_05595 [bacterium]|nr:hypothetical protein [bacterium]